VPGNLVNVGAASDGTVCGVDANGQCLQYAGLGRWTALSAPGAGNLAQVSVGSASAIWGTDTGGAVCQYNPPTNTWTPVSGITDGARSISAASDGSLWALSTSGSVYTYDGKAWAAVQAPEPMADISAGTAGWVWGIGQSGSIFQYDGSGNPWEPVNAAGLTLTWLSCGDDTTVWAGDRSGNLYRYDFDAEIWQPVPGTGSGRLVQVSVANSGTIWGVDASGNVYQYTANIGSWQPVLGAVPLALIAAGSGTNLWGLDQEGNIYRSPGASGPWNTVAGSLSWISVAADGSVWGTNQNHAVYSYNLATEFWKQETTAPALVQVAVASADEIVGIDASGNLYQLEGASAGWSPIPLGGIGIPANVCVIPGGGLWVVTQAGSVFQYLGQDYGWAPLAGTLKQISAGSAFNIWGIDLDGNALDLNPEPSAAPEAGAVQVAAGDGHGLRWETEDPFNEARSTHLWIVNRAALIAWDQGSAGQQIFDLVKPGRGQINDPFHDNLCQGLYDADFKSPWYDPVIAGQPWYVSHFYSPVTGQTFPVRHWSSHGPIPNALQRGRTCFITAAQHYLEGNLALAGYYLGLSLHFFTDLTQPMHAGLFIFTSSGPAFGYHTQFERYILETQSEVTPPVSYTAGQFGPDPDQYLIAAAQNAWDKYFDTLCPKTARLFYYGFDAKWPTPTWKEIADQLREPMLQDAITFTAQYLVAWMQFVQRLQGLPGYVGPAGGTGGTSVPKPPNPETVPAGSRITGFTVWAGKVINALQLSYAGTGGNGTITVGGTDLSPKPVTVQFEPDEYILSIDGKYGSSIDSLQISTNKKSYPTSPGQGHAYYGGSGGDVYFHYPIPSGLQMAGVFGMADKYLNSLGIIVQESAPHPSTRAPGAAYLFGPSGGNGGNSSDRAPGLVPVGGRITELDIWHSGHVDGIAVKYVDANGNAGVLPWQGGTTRKGDRLSQIEFSPGEYIIGISGCYDSYLELLLVTTNLCTYGPFGTGNERATFHYEVWPGFDLVGFFGQAGSTIDALGCVLRESAPDPD
jgi:phospholipase C